MLDKYFEWVEDRWETADQYPDELTIIGLGIGGEAGEVQENIKKHIRDDKRVLTDARREKLVLELGDVLHYWCRICQFFDISPVEIMLNNIDKLNKRDKRKEKEGANFTP